ncbi:hypothetical protein DMUE_5195 [Dictyocoela muelleri]|nr:hypothetical protein DMUE_5195 [Dictyocoela muelleri]
MNHMKPIFLDSQRGKSLLLYNNFIYNFEIRTEKYKRFRCIQRSCGAKLIYQNNGKIELIKSHKHDDQKINCMNLILKSKLKIKALVSSERSNDIITSLTTK